MKIQYVAVPDSFSLLYPPFLNFQYYHNSKNRLWQSKYSFSEQLFFQPLLHYIEKSETDQAPY